MSVLAVADDVAEATGDRSTAAWLATKTRDAHGGSGPTPGSRQRWTTLDPGAAPRSPLVR